MKMDMKITGGPISPKAFLKKLEGFDRKFMSALNAASKEAGAILLEAVRDEMMNEPLANATDYAAKKAAMGLFTAPLFRTQLMFNYLGHERRSFSWNHIAGQVGWPDTVRYPKQLFQFRGKSGVRGKKFTGDVHEAADKDDKPIWLAALINEKGMGANRPERPFVTRAYNKAAKRVPKVFASALARCLPISGLEEAPF